MLCSIKKTTSAFSFLPVWMPTLIKIVNYTTDSKAQNRLKTKVKGVLEEAAVNEMALPPHKRWPHGVPEPGLVDIKVKFSTETEYRATLKPGEWEDETVEVMPGFV
ncbi:uncharacterized protein EHS24_004647 [Apiotrichum porosum]|uniref:Uncharacterized protein n=1 Tax=Apiotrichum porosum TaxID=105984 RepID=A0A427Y5M8_9TREE|nr:uncharacterized protein EHS24_004647 [Apiotrichum porosum]RSH86397.1 hypothetical protein EHS24_004647 [Apiotrichum porosum]